ncbi:MAG: hypothetical protein ACRDMX_13625, partial [Solirubrobacteraceae bacterium]
MTDDPRNRRRAGDAPDRGGGAQAPEADPPARGTYRVYRSVPRGLRARLRGEEWIGPGRGGGGRDGGDGGRGGWSGGGGRGGWSGGG